MIRADGQMDVKKLIGDFVIDEETPKMCPAISRKACLTLILLMWRIG